jgi:hypothetical protein
MLRLDLLAQRHLQIVSLPRRHALAAVVEPEGQTVVVLKNAAADQEIPSLALIVVWG